MKETYVVFMVNPDGEKGFMDGFNSFEEAMETAEIYIEKGYTLEGIDLYSFN